MRIQDAKTTSLHFAYEQSGPKDGKPLFLVHGFPDSPRTFDKLLEPLHAAGFRTIAPYVRGFAPTEYRKGLLRRSPRRTGQAAAIAQDILDLADALKLSTFDYVGHDWGARAGYVLGAISPHRVNRLVALSVPFTRPTTPATSLPQDRAFWYQTFLCTEAGAEKLRKDPVGFGRFLWDTWSPQTDWYTQAEFDATGQSWTGQDFADTVLHAYRSRHGAAALDPDFGVQQARYDAATSLSVPTLLVHGLEDKCVLAETTDGAGRFFTGEYRRVLLDDVGHFPTREAPRLTSEEILRHLRGFA